MVILRGLNLIQGVLYLLRGGWVNPC